MNQTDIRNKIIEKQKERLQYFSYDSVKQELLTFIEDVIAKRGVSNRRMIVIANYVWLLLR